MVLALSIAAVVIGAVWCVFVLLHRRRLRAKEKLWDQQVAITRLLIQLQPSLRGKIGVDL